jgi:hypothetical protein
MLLTACGSPVAVMRRAVEPVNKAEILPVQTYENTGIMFLKQLNVRDQDSHPYKQQEKL